MAIFKPLPKGGIPKTYRTVPTGAKPKAPRTTTPTAVAAPKPPPEYWKVARVAKMLDVSKKRVYQLVQERRLEVIRLGPRQMRVLKSSLEELIGRLLTEEAERDY